MRACKNNPFKTGYLPQDQPVSAPGNPSFPYLELIINGTTLA